MPYSHPGRTTFLTLGNEWDQWRSVTTTTKLSLRMNRRPLEFINVTAYAGNFFIIRSIYFHDQGEIIALSCDCSGTGDREAAYISVSCDASSPLKRLQAELIAKATLNAAATKARQLLARKYPW